MQPTCISAPAVLAKLIKANDDDDDDDDDDEDDDEDGQNDDDRVRKGCN